MSKIYGNRWEIVNSLGEGGQAHVYLVQDVTGKSQEKCVLKRLKNVNRIDRFRAEIEAIEKLSHENVVRLIDFEIESGSPFLVSEYCRGGSLADSIPFWQGDPATSMLLFQQVCEGIVAAHEHGIIHRDIKPENVFLRTSEGSAVIGDFGICHIMDGARFTLIDEAVGPRNFMAPELEDGRAEAVSTKCDTYSLGKLLYWLLAGRSFSREKHRFPEWDLRGKDLDSKTGWRDIYMEHVNRLLDLMIVHDPRDRREVRNVLRISKLVSKLVSREFTPISPDIIRPCMCCGRGHYVLQAKSNTTVSNFGLSIVGGSSWRIFTCDLCGHVQMFRIDLAKKSEWWE